MIKDDVVFQAYCKKTNRKADFTLEDLYGYEGEECGVIIKNSGMVLSYNSGYGFDGMNPEIDISVKSINGIDFDKIKEVMRYIK